MKVKSHTHLSESPSISIMNNNTLDCCKEVLSDIFDKQCFLEQLRVERIRTQRSGTDLSLLLLTLDKYSTVSLREHLKMLATLIRETDIVGYIDNATLGVLLPYTDHEGARRFSGKILHCYINPQFSIATATFPDQIFDNLINQGCVSSDVLKLMLEDSIDNSRLRLIVKRAIDIVGSVFAIAALSPILLAAAVSVKFSSPGPIIFRQKRLGAKGIPFTFYKFRSMRTDTNDQIHREFVLKLIDGNNGNQENPLYKMKSDPRITPVGKIIRKTSIDELPQLFNVLKGDMSLVGPRPPLSYEAEKYKAWHLRRILEMKPGITGLWQVEGRGRKGFDDSVRLDINYLQNWSLALDFKILLKTVKEVLKCSGAY